MRNQFKIARLFGINIEIDLSWLLIFVLVTWSLATSFASTHPDWGNGLIIGVAVSASLLLFVSVLLHELAHSLVAKARGLPVRRIMLHLFGGVSNIEREPPSPAVEFWMALVGPVTSIALGIGLLLWAGLITPMDAFVNQPQNLLSQFSPLVTLLVWLGSVNIFLGLFNLIPGFPLDGGRILRSILWAVSNNLRTATQWAAWVGRVVAWGLIIAGVAMAFGFTIPLLGTGFINGLWLVFIGWFLNSSAIVSYQQVVLQDVLEDVPVSRMMRRDPPTVSPDMTVDQLVDEGIMATDDHAFPVVENDRLVGMVTLDDVRKVKRDGWASTRVSGIMTPASQLVSVNRDEDASEAMQKLRANDIRQVPVLDGEVLRGLLRRRDIMKWLQFQTDMQTDSL